MGIDLRGAGGAERLNHTSWSQLLRLASEYGWQPAGTQENEGLLRSQLEVGGMSPAEIDRQVALAMLEWDGNYWSNEYQIVTHEDARGLAEALTRALEELPADNLLDVYEVKIPLFRVGPEPDEESLELLKALPSLAINDDAEMVVTGLPSIVAEEAEPAHFWSGKAERIRKFIAFFEAGSFMIG